MGRPLGTRAGISLRRLRRFAFGVKKPDVLWTPDVLVNSIVLLKIDLVSEPEGLLAISSLSHGWSEQILRGVNLTNPSANDRLRNKGAQKRWYWLGKSAIRSPNQAPNATQFTFWPLPTP